MPYISLIILILLIPLIPTAYAGYIGAPWVPTRRRAIEKAFKQIKLSPEDTVIDLGSGDGSVLFEAAKSGAKSIGYELSPFMWAIASLRKVISNLTIIQFNNPAPKIFLRNFYKQDLPQSTTVIFVFLMPANMPRLKEYLRSQNLPNLKTVLAYTFPFKDIPPKGVVNTRDCGNIYIYDPAILK